jgi:magnesium transporter
MISRYTHHDITWVDIEKPSKEEMLHIMEEFSVPSLVAEEALSNTLHAKVERYDSLIYMVLHFPPSHRSGEKNTRQEIDFIIGKKVLITVHYESVHPLEQFSEAFESGALFEDKQKITDGGMLFAHLMKQIYSHTLLTLDVVTADINDIEHHIFTGHEDAMLKKISTTGKRLLDFKQALRFHQDILRSYESTAPTLYGEVYRHTTDTIISDFNKVNSLLESNRDALLELQRTNDSLLSTKTNDIMRTFTILTFVMMPLTIITGVFGMNTSDTLVFINNKGDFFFVIAAMTITGLVMFLFFKVRKWL